MTFELSVLLYNFKEVMVMKYVFILNSFGSRNVLDLSNKIKTISDNLGIEFKIEVNDKNTSTNDILKKYREGSRVIVAVGGDGMINKVVNGIVNTNNYFSYIPYGTGNDFDKTVTETLKDGINKIDLVKINNKYFINTACFGIDADIANDDRFVHNSLIPRKLRYNAGIVSHFIKYKPKHMQVLIDDEILEDDYSTIIVCNGRYYGGGYKVGPTSILNDGLFEVYLIGKLNKFDMAKAILSAKDGKHEENPHIRKIKTDSLFINSSILVNGNIDGEMISSETFRIDMCHDKIRLFYNPELNEKVLRK